MTRTVLVTGTAGFIGSHTAAGLHASGWAVTGVDVRPPGREPNRWEAITTDAADPALLARVAAGEFDVVVHQAAITDTLTPADERLEWANSTVPQRIARACASSGTRLVYASSGAVYGVVRPGTASIESDAEDRVPCSGPLNAYARSKLAMDQAMRRCARTDGLDFVGLRYTNVFGPGEGPKGRMASILWQIVTTAAAGRPVALFEDTLTAARDYIPVQLLVSALVRLLDHPRVSGIYNLGSAVPVRFETLLGWCTEWAGSPIPMIPVPNPVRDRYQYWTCADMRQLRSALPGLQPVTMATIRAYAHALFDRARAQATAPDELVKFL
ncbi:NAD-dependent epimerase/dehydratase family protein [Nocardia abscessus]|uniref:NAD-dependent epimerase/dehydratase family protein n=1 Tax=Nocardia abscessus TaxID=120957 RepID=UPI0018932001|nr:NAD-dependent epimerase/dehydratase family protein [Nocardia abscessus]MBF6340820.1 NAD-dependent epimerase/dehydratase family protein [Nocardia abscessus]